MGYAIGNALFQWEDGERRVSATDGPVRQDLEDAVDALVDELRRRLGSSFRIAELGDLYGSGLDWATALARARRAGVDAAIVVDAAFNRYAREAADYAGGRSWEPQAAR